MNKLDWLIDELLSEAKQLSFPWRTASVKGWHTRQREAQRHWKCANEECEYEVVGELPPNRCPRCWGTSFLSKEGDYWENGKLYSAKTCPGCGRTLNWDEDECDCGWFEGAEQCGGCNKWFKPETAGQEYCSSCEEQEEGSGGQVQYQIVPFESLNNASVAWLSPDGEAFLVLGLSEHSDVAETIVNDGYASLTQDLYAADSLLEHGWIRFFGGHGHRRMGAKGNYIFNAECSWNARNTLRIAVGARAYYWRVVVADFADIARIFVGSPDELFGSDTELKARLYTYEDYVGSRPAYFGMAQKRGSYYSGQRRMPSGAMGAGMPWEPDWLELARRQARREAEIREHPGLWSFPYSMQARIGDSVEHVIDQLLVD